MMSYLAVADKIHTVSYLGICCRIMGMCDGRREKGICGICGVRGWVDGGRKRGSRAGGM